jgi:hypothetical protein
MVTVASVMLALLAPPASARPVRDGLVSPWGTLFQVQKPRSRATRLVRGVPLPRPRPAEAPAAGAEPDQPVETPKQPEQEQPVAERKPQEPSQPSACRLALTEQIAIAPSIPDIKGAGGCGGEDLVRLEAVVLPDNSRVAVKPAAILRCTMASAVADWIRSDMAPLASSLNTKLADLDNFDSFECRGRNRVVGAKLSEHGRANALDVRGLKLANGQAISLTDRAAARELRETVLRSVCGRFSTVLGPGSDWYHEDHIHLDLAERRGGYRICQWNVWDPLPQVAPLLPAERPEEAPPREVVASKEAARDGARQAAMPPGRDSADPAAQPADEPDEAVPMPEPRPTKKRRNNRRF